MSAGPKELRGLVQTLTPALRTRNRVPKRHTKEQRRELKTAFKWNEDRNIIGFGVGPKCTENVPDYSRHSLVVFVVKKLAKSRIPKGRLVPARLDAGSLGARITTDVIEVGAIPKFQVGLHPGANAAHFTMRAGSVTAVVAGGALPANRMLLSCCHVFAPPGAGGGQIESPPDLSAITFTNHVADIAAFEPLRSGGNVANVMDAALALPLPGAPVSSNAIPNVGQLTLVSALRSGQFLPAGIRQALGAGATSGLVRVDIMAENAATLMADPTGAVFLFRDLVAYRPSPITQAGDSGMPIVRHTPAGLELLGMHIGLGRVANTTVGAAFFVPIAPVLARFNVRLAN